MPDVREIAVSNLLLDLQNPRLSEGQQEQADGIHAMLRAEGPKTLALARSIAVDGLSPMERFLVMRSGDPDQFIVLEGNRRLAALKILADPKLADGVLTPPQFKNLRQWSAEYHRRDEVDRVQCVVFATREEASLWIERRHSGEQGGVGVVPWGATEKARFARRMGKYAPELQVLDYIEQHASLDSATREKVRNVPITNLERLIADKAVREALGLEISEGRVLSRYPERETLKGLTRIVRDLADEEIRVTDIYTAADRQGYLKTFKPSELPTKSKALKNPYPLIGDGQATLGPSSGGAQARPAVRVPKLRATLIPSKCALRITVAKVANICRELRKLRLEDYPNAVAVLLRVFMELSVDAAIERKNLMPEQQAAKSKLREKIEKVADHLQDVGLLTGPQTKAVKRAANHQHLLTSVTTLHQYVHSKDFSPSPGDLRATWDNFQPFFEAIWR